MEIGDGMHGEPQMNWASISHFIKAGAFAVSAVLAVPTCSLNAQTGEWAWMSGSSTVSPQNGFYGTKGVASSANVPPGRSDATEWRDASGNFWIFGGDGYASVGIYNIHFNDLWKYDPATGEWTWMSGGDTGTQTFGTYGTLGVAATANAPGSRDSGVGWTDQQGNLWLFGGLGFDAAGNIGSLNDLWKFDVSTGLWTWMGGGSIVPNNDTDSCLPGVYGTFQSGSTGNTPGGRIADMGWTGTDGNFWLFGGGGCNANDDQALLNDLWKYSPSTGQWTWMSGSNVGGVPGVYGTLGTAAMANMPGSRWDATTWTDTDGNLWLFGGSAIDSAGNRGYLNDLWEFSPATNEWTWMSGSNSMGTQNCYQPDLECAPSGVYGTLGQFSAANVPGGRDGSTGAVDSDGDLVLFGGGNNANGMVNSLNDLWLFQISTQQWAWISGSDVIQCAAKDNSGDCVIDGQYGDYGSLGLAATSNVPGSRSDAAAWSDTQGNFWLFGGDGLDSVGSPGPLNDLWSYGLPKAAPGFTLSAGVNTLTINAGGQGTVTLTVTPQNGFNAPVTFSCSGLPTGVTCSFSPTSVTPSGSAATTTLTLADSAQSELHKSQPGEPLEPFTALALVAGLFGWRSRRSVRLMLFVVLASTALVAMTSCGGTLSGNSRSGGGNGGSAPISATVSVTATSGSIQQSTSLALTVN
jgi:N-acetylneuraminic acid mutarotase